MKNYYVIIVVLLTTIGRSNVHAQLVINKYAAVLEYQPCSNALKVDSAFDFSSGDTVLMIQMKGAVIDTSNTVNFGNILNYNGCGNYEYNVIKAINGNNVVLKYSIIRNYDIPFGKVQIVKVPSFQNYAVNSPHTCLPWNGSKGGVFAVYVTNTLTLNHNITVSEKGFKGGINNQNATQVGPVVCSNSNYYMAPNYDSGSMKGEGIAEISLAKSYGKGKLANGGGGGNAHNSGGAGGSNANSGGSGGSEYYGCNNNPLNNLSGGIAGMQLGYSNSVNKVFMGGGGGSAQTNNLSLSNGGSGGGICIITANTIIGNGQLIEANGKNGLQCINNGTFGSCHDGMSGGGGAGAILLNVDNINGNLFINAKGGKGADETANAGYFEVGPGGGGGGGTLWVKSPIIPPGVTFNLGGGTNGIVVYNNTNWGAAPGLNGQTLTNLVFNFPVDTFGSSQVDAQFSFDRTSCFTFNFTDQSTSNPGTINSWNWSFPNASGSSLQNPTYTFSDYGTSEVTLVVMNGNGCFESITREVNIPYSRFAFAGNDTGICANGSVQLNATGGTTYFWVPQTGLDNPNISSPVATPSVPTTYTVNMTNSIGCTDKDSLSVNLFPIPEINIAADGNIVSCDMRSLQLSATGGNQYVWAPGKYCNDSTIANPLVTPVNTTTFTVKTIDIHNCVAIDTMTVYVYAGSEAIFMPNAFSPNGDGYNEKIMPIILCNFNMDIFYIFNRFGERVFSTTKEQEGWDGVYKNKITDVGTYYYFISGRNSKGESKIYKGDIALIR